MDPVRSNIERWNLYIYIYKKKELKKITKKN